MRILLWGLIVCATTLPAQDDNQRQLLIRKKRASCRYVQSVLSPPEADVTIEDHPMLSKAKGWLRIGGLAVASIVCAKILVKGFSYVPVLGDIIRITDERAQICIAMFDAVQKATRAKNALIAKFTQGNRQIEAERYGAAVQIPDNLEDMVTRLLSEKTAIDRMLSITEKALAVIIFFILWYKFSEPQKAANWTYFGILEKVVHEWPDHKCYFPLALRPRFEILSNAYIARYNSLKMTEAEAKEFIESACIEVFDQLDTLYVG